MVESDVEMVDPTSPDAPPSYAATSRPSVAVAAPPPPPPVVPLKTIRLHIQLGGPSNYEVNISRLAKETGQRPPTPPALVKKVADSSDSDEDHNKDDKSRSKKNKKKNVVSDYYDTTDPFIDDSELAIDERRFFAQTKQEGFYVSSGEVALLKDITPKKPKSKKISFVAGLQKSLHTEKKQPQLFEGTRESPITIDLDEKMEDPSISLPDEYAGEKRKGQNSTSDGGRRKKIIDETMFHPELQVAIKGIKELVAQESWEQKSKFPPSLKLPLSNLAILAIKLDEYGEDFFALMPMLFPYNKFTMTKLIKQTIFADHLGLLIERQDALLAQLTQIANEGFSKVKEEWEKNLVLWDKRQEKLRTEAAEASMGTGSADPTRHSTEEMNVDGNSKDHGQHPPANLKRYRLTDTMKSMVWKLVLLSNECCQLETEKNSLIGSDIQISDKGQRKVLYRKIVAAFPEGWMTSGQISRDVSAMKKKLEKKAMEQEIDE